MTSNRREPALPQMKQMLGRAAANQIAREGAPAGRGRPSRIRRAPVRVRLLATLAVASVAAVAAVSAGAFDRSPVAPQLGPAESGVKPGVIPGETQVLHGPNGEVIRGDVSPCIKSDPSGYSNAELEDSEWCFHLPGAVSHGPRSDANPGTAYKRLPDGSFKVWRLPAE